MPQHSPTITVILKALSKTSKILARDFGEIENLQVSRKGPKDFVTASDMKVEKILIEELMKARPKYGILAEESGEIKGEDGEFRWIIDPIDGTTNFMHGCPIFCTAVALEQKLPSGKKEIIACVTEAPAMGETFWAEKGNGAWLENQGRSGAARLRVAKRTKIEDSLLCVGSFASDLNQGKNIETKFSAVRCIGSTALGLAYAASGRVDCFLQNGPKAWDIAGGILLVREAGGYVSDINGQQQIFETKTILAANDDLHNLVMKNK